MKKTNLILFVFLFSCAFNFLWAQSKEGSVANRKTAERCLKLAENCMMAEDWDNALRQSELGLAYDESISDLFYIKAMAQNNLNVRRGEVLDTIKLAFEKNSWVNYNKNGARVLYADLLSEIGLYNESLNLLNEKPLIYSADAEFIRIKNFYRIGTWDSINQARVKLNSSRKIYPFDNRFPEIFFKFEMLFMNYAELNGTEYEIPELVQTIADAYITRLPDYETLNTEIEIIALMFSEGEQQQRLLKAIGEINKNNPLYAFAALKAGIISEENAYNLFIESSGNTHLLQLLEAFALLIKNPGLKENFYDYLNSFSGMLYIDEDLDLRNELVIQYERGRSKIVNYDADNDQFMDMKVLCDFGTPVSIYFEEDNVNLFYEFYPYVKQINLNKESSNFYFLNDDFEFIPFEMTVDKIFETTGARFFIPFVKSEIVIPDSYKLTQKASCIELLTQERQNSRVVYTVFEGKPISATFNDFSNDFAYTTIEPGCPFVRFVDYDNDNIFETAETYDIDYFNRYSTPENLASVKKIFGENTFGKKVCLKKVEIDRNQDTVIEYREDFLGKNGKISYWDNDGNGLWDYEYIRYADDEFEALTEETIFYKSNGLVDVLLRCEDGKPVMILYNENTNPVVTGERENCYWIVQKGTAAQEEEIFTAIKNKLTNGMVQLFELKDNVRCTVIRVDDNYFFKLIPDSLVSDSDKE